MASQAEVIEAFFERKEGGPTKASNMQRVTTFNGACEYLLGGMGGETALYAFWQPLDHLTIYTQLPGYYDYSMRGYSARDQARKILRRFDNFDENDAYVTKVDARPPDIHSCDRDDLKDEIGIAIEEDVPELVEHECRRI